MQKFLEKNRWVLLISTSLLFGTTMFPAIWSVFQQGAADLYGISLDEAANLYPVCNIFYGLIFIIGGRLSSKINPKLMAAAGAAMMSMGVINLSFFGAGTNIITLYAAYSFFYGGGCGLIYPAVVTTYMRWYADKNGFANGVSLAGAAGVLMIFTYLSDYLLSSVGFTSAVRIIGIIFMVISVLCALLVCNPTDEYIAEKSALLALNAKSGGVTERPDFTSSEMIKTKQFWIFYIACLFALPGYLLIGATIVTFGVRRGLSQSLAVSTVAIATGGSAVAKFISPTLSDKFGRKRCSVVFLALQLVFTAALFFSKGTMVSITYIGMYLSFGGWMTLITPFVNDMFGLKYSGGNQGVVNTFNIFASLLAPMAVTALTFAFGDATRVAIGMISSVIALAAIVILDPDTAKLKK